MTLTALTDILTERTKQDAKWGVQNHDPFTYMTILTEEVGEAAQAALALRYDDSNVEELRTNLRTELVQVAAVALAMVECLDRNTWSWPEQRSPANLIDGPEARVQLLLTDHGIDGWDATTKPVAEFSSSSKALAYLTQIGYDYPQYGSFYAREEKLRNTMGAISYSIRPLPVMPFDPTSPVTP